VVGRAAQLRLEPAGGVAQLVREAAHVARKRVARAQVVEHRAANAELGERLEPVDALWIEPLRGLHQADDTRRDQVVDLDVGGQPPREPPRHLFNVGKKLSCVLIAAREQVLLRVALGSFLGRTVGRLALGRRLRGRLGDRLRGRHGACP
jgi:hypothetical protein